jgi:curved DNA-binding protein
MEFQDYYATLGVPKTATQKEIRSAYRKLARQHHPDVNPGNKEAEERFKAINEAYEVLSDPEKRKKYDEVGAHWKEYEQWQRAREAAGASAQPEDFAAFRGQTGDGVRYEYRTVDPEDLRDIFGDQDPFSDFFSTFFGRTDGRTTEARTARPRAGYDLEQPVDISLDEAYTGTQRMIAIQQPERGTKRLEVKIPAGVESGSRVRVAGQGMPGQAGGRNGDLYLVIGVRDDPRFERRGDGLYTKVRVPLATMLLGGEARVSTPDRKTLALTIPAETPDGQSFRLRGRGMPHLGAPERRGDLHAEVHAELPQRLTERQRDLVRELAGEGVGVS